MTSLRTLPRLLYSATWIQFLRLRVLRAYFRRDFQTFDRLVDQIRPYDSAFAQFCSLFKRQLLDGNVRMEEWKSLLENVENQKIHPIVHRKIYTEFVTKAVQAQDTSLATQTLFEKIQKFGFHRADISLSHGILKLFLKQDDLENAQRFRDELFQRIQKEKIKVMLEFKLLEVSLELEVSQGAKFSKPLWKVAFDRIAQSGVPEFVKSAFEELKLLYCEIEKQHELLLDIRTSLDEQAHATKMIQNHLQENKPFLLLRLGDGESYGLSANAHTRLEDNQTRERKWWGALLPQDLRDQLVRRFRSTLDESNAVGIPGVFRFVRDTWNSLGFFDLDRFKPKTTFRGIQAVMAEIKFAVSQNKYSSDVIFIEHRCHQVLFSKERVAAFAKFAKKVLVVSQYDPALVKNIFSEFEMEAIQVPKERMLHASLPYKTDEIAKQIEQFAGPGILALVCAGFAGKYFLKVAKDQGAVAVDAGAMADYWMDLKTRQITDIV